jgi:hypothetical protein
VSDSSLWPLFFFFVSTVASPYAFAVLVGYGWSFRCKYRADRLVINLIVQGHCYFRILGMR